MKLYIAIIFITTFFIACECNDNNTIVQIDVFLDTLYNICTNDKECSGKYFQNEGSDEGVFSYLLQSNADLSIYLSSNSNTTLYDIMHPIIKSLVSTYNDSVYDANIKIWTKELNGIIFNPGVTCNNNEVLLLNKQTRLIACVCVTDMKCSPVLYDQRPLKITLVLIVIISSIILIAAIVVLYHQCKYTVLSYKKKRIPMNIFQFS